MYTLTVSRLTILKYILGNKYKYEMGNMQEEENRKLQDVWNNDVIL